MASRWIDIKAFLNTEIELEEGDRQLLLQVANAVQEAQKCGQRKRIKHFIKGLGYIQTNVLEGQQYQKDMVDIVLQEQSMEFKRYFSL